MWRRQKSQHKTVFGHHSAGSHGIWMGCWILPQACPGWHSWSLLFWRTKSKRAPKFLYLGGKGTAAILGLDSQSWVMLNPYCRVLHTCLSMSKCYKFRGRMVESKVFWGPCPRPAEFIQFFECVNRRPRVGLPSLEWPVPSSVTVHPLYILPSPPTHIIIQAWPPQMCKIRGTTSPKMASPALSWSPAVCLAWLRCLRASCSPCFPYRHQRSSQDGRTTVCPWHCFHWLFWADLARSPLGSPQPIAASVSPKRD